MRVAAVIPARGGSKGLPGKNMLPVGGIPLVGRSVLAATRARRIDAVYCSSDDAAILETAGRYGAIGIRRPAALAGDGAGSEAALLHALDVMRAAGQEPQILVFLQCTSPFTTAEELDRLVAALDDPEFACALTVQASHAFLWRDSPGGGRGVNHDEAGPRLLRQERPPEFRETGAGYAMRTRDFRAVGRRFCGRVALVETFLHPVEIDAPHDLQLAEALVRQGGALPVPAEALRRVTTLVTDFDGVHTDDRVSIGQDGTESVTCSRADGDGIARLKAAGYRILILSRERNAVVARRAAKLGVEVLQGVDDKAPLLEAWLGERGLGWQEVAYVGNDANDLGCLARAGVSFAPVDAQPAAARAARASLSHGGGHGAVREVCDLLLAHGR